MNRLSKRLITGTIGELLVQLRLLQYGVQAAPPLKDSGNDLIAVRGKTIKTIQVKTTTISGRLKKPSDRLYHILAFVRLDGEGTELELDSSEVYLIEKEVVDGARNLKNSLDAYKISQGLVDRLFPPSSEE